MLNLVYGILICAIGIPMFGGFQLEAGTLLCIILDGLLIMVSYAAMFNLLAMLPVSYTHLGAADGRLPRGWVCLLLRAGMLRTAGFIDRER